MLVLGGLCQAQIATDISQYQVERLDDEIVVSAQVVFELPAAVEEALLKGIPMFFVTEADVMRERWYWYDKKIVSAQRHMRLAYQPLTRRWRLNVTPGSGRDLNLGFTLNQSFESLEEALAAIKRISRWKIADAAELDSGVKYKVGFSFRLDQSQLPRPLQIGALGQSDWDITATASTTLMLATLK
ncbi:MAG: DUF4390 domain-containing protein [Pseudomonadota bacterium]